MANRMFNDIPRGPSDDEGNEESNHIPNHVESRITRLETTASGMLSSLARIEAKLDNLGAHFVTHVEFWPVKAIVYTGAGTMLLAVLGAIIALVVRATT